MTLLWLFDNWTLLMGWFWPPRGGSKAGCWCTPSTEIEQGCRALFSVAILLNIHQILNTLFLRPDLPASLCYRVSTPSNSIHLLHSSHSMSGKINKRMLVTKPQAAYSRVNVLSRIHLDLFQGGCPYSRHLRSYSLLTPSQ